MTISIQYSTKHKAYTPRQKGKVTPEIVSNIVCNYFDLDHESVYKNTRKSELVLCRMFIMYFIKKYSGLGCLGIAKEFPSKTAKTGHKDHSTVLSALRTFRNLCDTDKVVNHDLKMINEILSRI